MRRISALLILLTLPLCALFSCNTGTGIKVKTQEFYEYFDTRSIIQSYNNDTAEEFRNNCDTVRDVLQKYHRLFDIYYEYAGINNLRTVNKNAGVAPVSVDREIIDFLLYCKDIYTLTNGETNIALGSVLKIWHDKREAAEKAPILSLPTEAELSSAAKHTSIDLIVIDEVNSTVYITDPKASIDVGAIGKGYATEKARLALIDKGVTSYVLNIGGNICCIGAKPDGSGWLTAIKDPHTQGSYAAKATISDICCVTSGSYERYFTYNGKNYHHIIDKDTLMPSEHFASVTVFCESSALADALSTALFAMSYEDGLELAMKLSGVEVLWIDNLGNQYMTDGVCEFLNK